MILWIDGALDVAEQMRRDAALLERLETGGGTTARTAVLRLYRFRPAGITLGHAQRAEAVLDLAALRADGVDWARRPTGGRAVYHDQEWTYALAARIDDPDWGGSMREAYLRASTLIRDALRRVGIPADLVAGRRAEEAAAGVAPLCFVATARHEITLGGRKLVGSAQRRLRRALLQQGSILTGPSHARLARYLRDTPARARAGERLRAEAADPGPRWHGAPLEPFAAAVRALAAPAEVLVGDQALERLTLLRGSPYARPQSRTGTGDTPPHRGDACP